MEVLITVLLVGAIVAFFVIRSSAKRKEMEQEVQQDGRQPYFTFKGNAFVSKEEAWRKLGDYGLKFILALFRGAPFLRLSLYYKKEWRTYDIDFSDITSVERIVLRDTLQLIAMTFDSEVFPLPELYLHPGEYKVLDALNEALHPKVAASQ